jgi:hypothetical protein
MWGESQRKFQKSAFDGPSFEQVVEEIFKRCDEEEIRLFVGIARRVWLQRNDVVHGGPFLHPTVFVQQANDALSDFSTTMLSRESNTPP